MVLYRRPVLGLMAVLMLFSASAGASVRERDGGDGGSLGRDEGEERERTIPPEGEATEPGPVIDWRGQTGPDGYGGGGTSYFSTTVVRFEEVPCSQPVKPHNAILIADTGLTVTPDGEMELFSKHLRECEQVYLQIDFTGGADVFLGTGWCQCTLAHGCGSSCDPSYAQSINDRMDQCIQEEVDLCVDSYPQPPPAEPNQGLAKDDGLTATVNQGDWPSSCNPVHNVYVDLSVAYTADHRPTGMDLRVELRLGKPDAPPTPPDDPDFLEQIWVEPGLPPSPLRQSWCLEEGEWNVEVSIDAWMGGACPTGMTVGETENYRLTVDDGQVSILPELPSTELTPARDLYPCH